MDLTIRQCCLHKVELATWNADMSTWTWQLGNVEFAIWHSGLGKWKNWTWQNTRVNGIAIPTQPVFIFQICDLWGKWVGNQPKEGLAKFGYRSESIIENFKNPATCWPHTRTYYLPLMTRALFWPNKTLCTICNPFFSCHQDVEFS
jgi:hypothetical protein